MYTVGVIIVSDRVASGIREDKCLPVFRRLLRPPAWRIVSDEVVPDDVKSIRVVLRRLIRKRLQLIFTAGGTGCAPRDVTPEATAPLLERATLGIDEAIRTFSRSKSPYAIFSRGCSGIVENSLIINLPGSPKAVGQILRFLLSTLDHPLKLMNGGVHDCADKEASND